MSVLAGMQSFMATSVLIALVFATGLALERERGLAMVAHQREVEAATSAALEREREANVRMQSMDRAKNELISTISHELRTPLTSIVGYVELLEDDADLAARPSGRPAGSGLRATPTGLLALAKDVLRIAAVDEREFGSRQAAHRPARLRRWRRRTRPSSPLLATTSSRSPSRCPTAPVPVHADAQEIERVVFNFVSNAIKFTPGPGTVRVWLATLGATARISVEDTGLGISREDQKRIFERFFRTSIARQQRRARHRPGPEHRPLDRRGARRRPSASSPRRGRGRPSGSTSRSPGRGARAMIMIDPPAVERWGRVWSHLASDESFEELHAFAARRRCARPAASIATTTTCRRSGTTTCWPPARRRSAPASS